MCVEHGSAKYTNRPGLQELLEQLRPGDTFLVHSIDRLCRNMSEYVGYVAVTTRLRNQGVTLIFLKEQLTFCADIKKIQEIDALRSRGIRLRVACDHAGLGVSTYYKLRNKMNNQ
ncbi:TPA: recombinase family protein [Yersinia enterocolitica]|nr:recombinase family protein [Yersinia enterocolitica]